MWVVSFNTWWPVVVASSDPGVLLARRGHGLEIEKLFWNLLILV
jgi:hypothetical protein